MNFYTIHICQNTPEWSCALALSISDQILAIHFAGLTSFLQPGNRSKKSLREDEEGKCKVWAEILLHNNWRPFPFLFETISALASTFGKGSTSILLAALAPFFMDLKLVFVAPEALIVVIPFLAILVATSVAQCQGKKWQLTLNWDPQRCHNTCLHYSPTFSSS